MDSRLAAVGAALILAAAGPAAASDHGWRVVSDVGDAALLGYAVGATAYQRDGDGARELGLSLATTAAATYGLKHAFPEMRPNGRDNRSFPSGHTSVAFASAGYLQQRYGWRAGLPATVVAGVVGLARVQAHEHHWYDVVAGAALGEASAVLLTHRQPNLVAIAPWGDTHGGGFSLAARF